MCKKDSTKIVYIMTHRAGVLVLGLGQIGHIVKTLFLTSSFLILGIDQTNYVSAPPKENFKFHDPQLEKNLYSSS